jgi:hypothetical protein
MVNGPFVVQKIVPQTTRELPAQLIVAVPGGGGQGSGTPF